MPRPRMTSAEREARALQRAFEERIYVRRIPGRPGTYTTKSRTTPGERYFLVNVEGVQACSCPGFYYRQECKHMTALRKRLGRETQREKVYA